MGVSLPAGMRRNLCFSVLGACLACGLALAQPVIYLVDQAHDTLDVSEGIHSLVAYPTVTQEFTPRFGALDIVEIYTRDWSFPSTNGIGGTLQVSIREDSTNGAVLAVSAPLELADGWLGPSQFLFTNLVWLTSGKRHAIEIRLLEGNNWGVDSYGTFAPPYGGGRYFVGTNLVTTTDLWFRTGVRPPAARLAIDRDGVLRWAGVSPLTYSVWTSSDLGRWNHAGFVQSETSAYFFTNNVPGAPGLFYKVSYP